MRMTPFGQHTHINRHLEYMGTGVRGILRLRTFPSPLKSTIALRRTSAPAGLLSRALRAKPP